MSRGGRLAWGLALVLGFIILWLLMRSQQRFAEGDVTLGNVFFGGYDPGSLVLRPRLPNTYVFDLAFQKPTPLGALPGGPSDMPCACGCVDIKFDFLDLTDWVAEQNAALYSQVTGEIQQFFSYNPWAYNFANANRIKEFAD